MATPPRRKFPRVETGGRDAFVRIAGCVSGNSTRSFNRTIVRTAGRWYDDRALLLLRALHRKDGDPTAEPRALFEPRLVHQVLALVTSPRAVSACRQCRVTYEGNETLCRSCGVVCEACGARSEACDLTQCRGCSAFHCATCIGWSGLDAPFGPWGEYLCVECGGGPDPAA
jgi:hypothetical protein